MKVTQALAITSVALALGPAACFPLNMTAVRTQSSLKFNPETETTLMSVLDRGMFVAPKLKHTKSKAASVSPLQSGGESPLNCFSSSFCEESLDDVVEDIEWCCCELRDETGLLSANECFLEDFCNTVFVNQTTFPGHTLTCGSPARQASLAFLTTIVAVMTFTAI